MTTYTRVRYQPVGGKPRNVILEDAVETRALKAFPNARFLTGLECNRDGNSVFDGPEPSSTIIRRHYIDFSTIIKQTPMHMDMTYGELVDGVG